MKKRFLMIMCMLVAGIMLNAQPSKRTNIWYFGSQVGLDFSSGSPVALTNGKLGSYEGCGVMSDESGNLLFYTNGNVIWDSNHDTMPNGSGLTSTSSASQTGLCIPHPGDTDLYYVFTTGHQESVIPAERNLFYSIVDMSLNGGLGDVISGQKNQVLLSDAVEKVTGVLHDNCNDIWVISHNNGTSDYYAYLISDTGLNTTPVISSVGTTFPPAGDAGYLKVSHDGSVLVNAMEYSTYVEMYDFDNATGAISNPYKITGMTDAYGIEFSMDMTRLYISTTRETDLFQFDLTAADIAASKTYIGSASSGPMIPYQGGALQMGPDGKIYMAAFFADGLDVINNPNGLGAACNFQNKGVLLGMGKYSQIGLPAFLQHYFYQVDFSIQDTCAFNGTTFTLTSDKNVSSADWDFGDGQSSSDINPTNNYSSTGSFTVELVYEQCGVSDTVEKDITIVDCGPAPVELVFLEAVRKEANIIINWSTASETNNDYFLIERSGDGKDFYTIGSLKGNGNKNDFSTYQFRDENPIYGYNYYRLKQVDYDGSFSYSKTVHIESGNSSAGIPERIFISNQTESITFQIPSGCTSYILYNTHGQVIRKEQVQTNADNKVSISKGSLSEGVYIVKWH